MRIFITWKFLLLFVAVALLNMGAQGVMMTLGVFPYGYAHYSSALGDVLVPPSSVIMKPHMVLYRYAWITSPLIVLAEAVALQLLLRIAFPLWRQKHRGSSEME
jgi:hypothetical protein